MLEDVACISNGMPTLVLMSETFRMIASLGRMTLKVKLTEALDPRLSTADTTMSL
ncbi:hypothetical protein D3C71_1994040 [compost metagenome]